MKKLTTIISCSMLLLYGLLVGINNRADPGVTVQAAPVMPVIGQLPYDLQLSHMKRDPVNPDATSQVCNHKENTKVIKVPYAVHDTLYVPVLYIASSEGREEQPCSDSQAKYVVRKASPEDINCETTFTPGEDDYDHSVEDTSVSTYNESHQLVYEINLIREYVNLLKRRDNSKGRMKCILCEK